MNERSLLSACLKHLRMTTGAVIIKHNDAYTSGIPDVSITWRGCTSWWEFKHGDKVKWANPLQQLTCKRFASAGQCYIVLYEARGEFNRTVILTPDGVELASARGFDHKFVARFMERAHG